MMIARRRARATRALRLRTWRLCARQGGSLNDALQYQIEAAAAPFNELLVAMASATRMVGRRGYGPLPSTLPHRTLIQQEGEVAARPALGLANCGSSATSSRS